MNYKGKAVLVTGSSGFIGSALVARLRGGGAEVVEFDLRNDHDVLDCADLHGTFDAYRPDAVFHLAAETEVLKSLAKPAEAYTTNFVGTLNVLEMCRKYSTPRLVVASTDKVYGEYPFGRKQGPPEEGDELRPSPNPYAESKRMADELCRDYRLFYRIPVVVVRSVNTFGPGQRNTTTLITNTVRRILAGLPPQLAPHDAAREWLYIDDAVEAYMLIGGAHHQFAFNVGSGHQMRVSQVVGAIAQLMDTSTPACEPLDVPFNDYDQSLDCRKFRTWFPEWVPTSFVDGLAKTIRWYRENP